MSVSLVSWLRISLFIFSLFVLQIYLKRKMAEKDQKSVENVQQNESNSSTTAKTTDVTDGNSSTTTSNDNVSVKTVENLLKQINLVGQMSSTANNRSAPKSEEEAASRQEWKFWNTQPVPTIGEKITAENNGPVEPNKSNDELRQEPYKLPDGFSWDELDIVNDDQVKVVLHTDALLPLCWDRGNNKGETVDPEPVESSKTYGFWCHLLESIRSYQNP